MSSIISRKKAYVILILLAAVALLFSAAGVTQAYFTSFVTAHGYLPLELETEITIHEEFDGVAKLITVENTGEYDCWARIRVITPPGYPVEWPSGGSWAQKDPDDGYWYYTSQLPVGAATAPQFRAGIAEYVIDGQEPPEFNIAVIAECIPAAGVGQTWEQADWDLSAPEEEAKK